MSLSRTIDAMIASGCSVEQVAAVVRAHEASQEAAQESAAAAAAAKRAKAAAKKRAQREAERLARMSLDVPGTDGDIEGQAGTSGDTGGQHPSPKERSPTPPKEITPTHSSLRSVSSRAHSADEFFDRDFWPAYPKREGSNPKEPAKRKYRTLIAAGIPAAEITEGLARFKAAAANTDPRFIPQAVTWLGQMRWRDEHLPPAARAPMSRAGPAHRYPPRRSTNGWADLLLEDMHNERPHDDPTDARACATDPGGRDSHRDLSFEARAGGATVLDARVVRPDRH